MICSAFVILLVVVQRRIAAVDFVAIVMVIDIGRSVCQQHLWLLVNADDDRIADLWRWFWLDSHPQDAIGCDAHVTKLPDIGELLPACGAQRQGQSIAVVGLIDGNIEKERGEVGGLLLQYCVALMEKSTTSIDVSSV